MAHALPPPFVLEPLVSALTAPRRPVSAAVRDQSRSHRGQLPARDQVFLGGTQGFVEVPAVQVRAAYRRPDVEARVKRGGDALERMQVMAQLGDHGLRRAIALGAQ